MLLARSPQPGRDQLYRYIAIRYNYIRKDIRAARAADASSPQSANTERSFLLLRFRNWPGFEVEDKKAAVAGNFRGASKETISRGYDVLPCLLARREGLRLLCENKVWDTLPNEEVTKRSAARIVLEGDGSMTPNTFAVYVGDDFTDETVFRNLRPSRSENPTKRPRTTGSPRRRKCVNVSHAGTRS